MRLSGLLISFILFGILTGSLVMFYVDLSRGFEKNIGELRITKTAEEIRSHIEAVKADLEKAKGMGIVGVIWGGIRLVYQAVIAPFFMFNLVVSLVGDLGGLVGIPPFITYGIISAVLIFIAYEILSAFMKYRM